MNNIRIVIVNIISIAFFCFITLYTFEIYIVIKHYYDKNNIGTGLNGAFNYLINNKDTKPSLFFDVNFIAALSDYKIPHIDNEMIYPLGQLSNSKLLLCKESNNWITINTDEHGFRNLKGLYQSKIDIALIGDSFVEGQCVDENNTISGKLREKYHVINLGRGGAGPLYELAIYKEYAENLFPRIVLWFYYPANDLDDMVNEEKTALTYYMNSNFNMGLVRKQIYIDKFMNNMHKQLYELNEKRSSEDQSIISNISIGDLKNVIKLKNITYNYGFYDETYGSIDNSSNANISESLETYKNILLKVKEKSDNTGSLLYFVILPYINYYMNINNKIKENDYNKYVIAMKSHVRNINVPIIDVNEYFIKFDNPTSFWAKKGNIYGHFNEAGYKIVAESIMEELSRKGFKPTK